jgi:phenylacetate-CoA ligase
VTISLLVIEGTHMTLTDRLAAWFTELYTVRRDRNRYVPLSRKLNRTQYDPPGVIRARQLLQLRTLVRYAYDHVPFYRRRFDDAGVRPDDVRSFADFAALPVLTKADVRGHAADLLSPLVPESRRVLKSTSGSTGVPLRVWVDWPSIEWKAACTLRADQWSGWRLGEPVAKVWGNPEYKKHGLRGRLRNLLIERAEYLDTLHVTDETLEDFTRRVRRQRPRLIFGHAHSVYLFAQYLERTGQHVPRPAGIITSAMTLHRWQRELIEGVLACKVTDRYGCEEVSVIACECEEHRGYHASADSVYVEVEGASSDAATASGPLLVTDLTNFAMPLVRYRLGDTGTLSDRRCDCGRTLPLIEQLNGREADYLTTPEGVQISGVSLTENFILEIPGVEQVQIIQHAGDRFTLRVVREKGFEPYGAAQCRQVFRKLFGDRARCALEYVDRIPREANGKYRFCINEAATPPARETAGAR